MKQCIKCKENKPLDSFYNKLNRKDGKSSWCKNCDNEHNKKWIKSNIDRYRDNRRDWRNKNTDKIKQYANTTYERERLLKPEQARNRKNRWKVLNPEKDKLSKFKSKLKSLYKMGLEDYNKLLNSQLECCAICGIDSRELKKKLNIDHSHEDGKVRELLCSNCNSGLGHFKDKIEFLEKAVEYLRKAQR